MDWRIDPVRLSFRAIDGDEYCVAADGRPPPGWVPVSASEARWLFDGWRDREVARQVGEACGIAMFEDRLPSFAFERVLLLRRERPLCAMDMDALSVVDLRDLAEPEEPEPAAPVEHYIEVRVLDDALVPIEGAKCSITTPDGQTHALTTDQHGLCRVDEIAKAGACLVELPDLEVSSAGHATDALHEFVALTVRAVDLRFHAWQWQRLVGCPVQLLAASVDDQTTDGGGEVTLTLRSIVPDARAVMVTPANEHGYDGARSVEIATLDPVDTPRGQRARLDNLGYVWMFDDDAEAPSIYAIEEFQCEHGLTVDGVCDPPTQAKLLEVHGH